MIPGGINKVRPDAKAGNKPPAEETSTEAYENRAQAPSSSEKGAFDQAQFAALTKHGIRLGLGPLTTVHASRPGNEDQPTGLALTEEQITLVRDYFEWQYEFFGTRDKFGHMSADVVIQQLQEHGCLQGEAAEEWEEYIADLDETDEEEGFWVSELAFVRTDPSAAAVLPAADPIEEVFDRGIADDELLHVSLDFLLSELSQIFDGEMLGDSSALTELLPIAISDDLPQGVEGAARLPHENTIHPHHKRAEKITLRTNTSVATLAHELAHAVDHLDLSISFSSDFFIILEDEMSLYHTYQADLSNMLIDEGLSTSIEAILLSRIENKYEGALKRRGFSEYDRRVLDRFRDHVQDDFDTLLRKATDWLKTHPGYFSYRFAAFVRALFLKAGLRDETPCLEDLLSLAGFGNAREHEFSVDAEQFKAFTRQIILPYLKDLGDDPTEWIHKIRTLAANSSIDIPRVIRFLRGQLSDEEIAVFLREDFGNFVQIASNAIESAQKARLAHKAGITQKLKPRPTPMKPGDVAAVQSRPDPVANAIEAMAKFTEVLFEMGDSIFSHVSVYNPHKDELMSNPRLGALIDFALRADPKSSARAFDMMISAMDQREMPMYEKARIAKALLDAGYEKAGNRIMNELKSILDEDHTHRIKDADKAAAIFKTVFELGNNIIAFDREIANAAMSPFKDEDTIADQEELKFATNFLDQIPDEAFDRMPHTQKAFNRIVNMIENDFYITQRGVYPVVSESRRTLNRIVENAMRKITSGTSEIDAASLIGDAIDVYFSKQDTDLPSADAIAMLYLKLPKDQQRSLQSATHPPGYEAALEGDLWTRRHDPLNFWFNLHHDLSEDAAIAILDDSSTVSELHTNFIIKTASRALLDSRRSDRMAIARNILNLIHISSKTMSKSDRDVGHSILIKQVVYGAYAALTRTWLYALAEGDEAMLSEASSKLEALDALDLFDDPDSIDAYSLAIARHDSLINESSRLKADLQVLVSTDTGAREKLLSEIENDVALNRGSFSNVGQMMRYTSTFVRLRGTHAMDQALMRLGRAYIDQTITASTGDVTSVFSSTLNTIHNIPIPNEDRDDLLVHVIKRTVPRIRLFRLADIKALPHIVSDASFVLKNRHLYPKSEALLLEKIREAIRDVRPFPDMELNETLVSTLLPLWNAYADAAHLDPAQRDEIEKLRADPEYHQALDMLTIFAGEHQKIDRAELLERYAEAIKISDETVIEAHTRPLRDEISSELRDKLIGQRNGFDKVKELVDRRIPKRDEVANTLLERLYADWISTLEKSDRTFADVLLPAWAVATERSDARQRAPILLEALSKDIVPRDAKRVIARQLFRTGEYDTGFIKAYEMAVSHKDSQREDILFRLMQPIYEGSRITFPRTILAAFVMDSSVDLGLEFAQHYESILKGDLRRGRADITPQDILKQAIIWHSFAAARSSPDIAFIAYTTGTQRRDLSQYLAQDYVSLSLMRHALATGRELPSTKDGKLKMSPNIRRLVARISQEAESIVGGWGDEAERFANVVALQQIMKKYPEGASLADYDRVLAEFPDIVKCALRAEDQASVLEMGEIDKLKDRDPLTRHLVERFLVQLSHGERQGIALGIEDASRQEVNRVFFERSGLEKIGQFLSYWPQVPADVREELKHLQAHVAPTPTALVRDFIEQTLGDHPEKESILSNLSSTPIASGTIGETYESRLSDGRRVAVKVIPPQKEEKFFTAIERLFEVARRTELYDTLEGGPEAVRLMDLYVEIVADELDLTREATNQREAMNISVDGVSSPAFIDGLVFPKLSVMEYVDGVRIDEIEDADVLDSVKSRARQAFLSQVVNGTYNSDPQPGNFLYDAEHDTLHMLDFGQVGRVNQDQFANVRALLNAMGSGDIKSAVDALEQMGSMGVNYSRSALTQQVQGIFSSTETSTTMGSAPVFDMFSAATRSKVNFDMPYMQLLKGAATMEATLTGSHTTSSRPQALSKDTFSPRNTMSVHCDMGYPGYGMSGATFMGTNPMAFQTAAFGSISMAGTMMPMRVL